MIKLALVSQDHERRLQLCLLLDTESHSAAPNQLQIIDQTCSIHSERSYYGNRHRPLGFKGRIHSTMAFRRLCSVFVARSVRSRGRPYTEDAPSRSLVYSTNISEATVSLDSSRPLPAYRVLNSAGHVLDAQQDPNVGHTSSYCMKENLAFLFSYQMRRWSECMSKWLVCVRWTNTCTRHREW